jgi:uncharacterized protein (DUF58 family)
MSRAQFKYLDPEAIRRLASFEFAPKTVVEGYFAGRHRSRSRGSSTEFRDYRAYAPGDDLRAVDWRVLARTDRAYLRTYDQETDLSCHIVLDGSASMGFGAGLSKLEYASFFAAALSYLVIKRQDRVSLTVFDEAIRHFLPPGGTRLHLHNILHALEGCAPGSRTSVAASLRRAFPLMPQRGALVVVSDFYDEPGTVFEALSPYLHRGFRVYLFHVLAAEELDIGDRGLLAYLDMETGERVLAHAAALRRAYGEAVQSHIQGMRELAVRRGVSYTVARTDTHYFTLFDRFLE